jgi:MFS family permease
MSGVSTSGHEPEAPAPPGNGARTLFVVVHGIGDPTLGETVREVARGMTHHLGSVGLIEETHWIPGPDRVEADAHSVQAFPVPVLSDRGGDFVLAEVHWADLSRLPISMYGLVSGFFAVLFGLRYVAYQAVDGLDAPGAGALRRLVRAATTLVIGPYAAMSLLALFILLGGVLADRLSIPYERSPDVDYFASLSTGTALLVGALLARCYRGHQVLSLLGTSLCGVASTLLAVVGIGLLASGRGPGLLGELLVFGQGFSTWSDALDLLWVLIFVTIGLIQLAILAVLGWMAATVRERPKLTSAAVAASLPFVMTFAWSIVMPLVWAAAGTLIPVSQEYKDHYQSWLAEAAPLWDPYYYVLLPFFVVFLMVVAWWFRRRNRPRLEDDGARLIVNAWLQWGIVALYVVAAVLALLFWKDRHAGAATGPERVGSSLMLLIAPALGLLPFLISQGSPYLRSAIDLIHDVVNHFYFRFRDVDGRRGPPPFPVRRAIEARLDATLDHFAGRLDDAGGPPWRLVVLSHSQGTVAAIESLNNPDNRADRFRDIRLVTMGSPFSHIYQHYFRHHYPPLDDARWQVLRRRLAAPKGPPRWLNLFRIDDYVGRSIEATGSAPRLVANIPIGPRGHLGYWFDPDVLRQIDSALGILPRGPGIRPNPGA